MEFLAGFVTAIELIYLLGILFGEVTLGGFSITDRLWLRVLVAIVISILIINNLIYAYGG